MSKEDQSLLEAQASEPVASPVIVRAADTVRPATPADVEAIGRLFQATFRRADMPPSAALLGHLRTIYFNHPWQDPEITPLVFQSANGQIDGFIGVMPLRLKLGERPMRGAVAGALMVNKPHERPLAGARLLRGYFAGPQDLSFGDTANWTSQMLWERLGGHMLPMDSLEWLRVIRPFRFGATVAGARMPWKTGALLKPLAALAEGAATLRRGADKTPPAVWFDATVGEGAYFEAHATLSRAYELRLDFDQTSADWFLLQAAQKRRYGPLTRRVVYNRAGKPVGSYLIYARRGAVAETLQVTADPRHAEAVMESMTRFARDAGASALRGKCQAALMSAVYRAGGILRHRCSTVVHSSNPEIVSALDKGRALLGGFFGETWTKLVSDDFGTLDI